MKPLTSLCVIPAHKPEPVESQCQSQGWFSLICVNRPVERGAQVVNRALQAPEPSELVRSTQLFIRLSGKIEEIRYMLVAFFCFLAHFPQAIPCKLLDGYQHGITHLVIFIGYTLQEALIEE